MKSNARSKQIATRTGADWSGANTLFAQSQPQESEKPLVVQQANEIALLQDALEGSKDATRLKERLVSLKRRWEDPSWHEHLSGRAGK